MSTAGVALVLMAASAALVWLGGCESTTGGTSQVGHYVVRVPTTPMFRYGPAQSFGPDFSLRQGQHVIMLKREYGYSRVMTDDGQSGYVATEDLAAAPPPPPPVQPKKPSRSGFFTRRGGSSGGSDVSSANRQVIQSGPLFGPDELPPLPEADPLQPAKPGFRVNVPEPAPSAGSTPPKLKPGFRVGVPEKKE